MPSFDEIVDKTELKAEAERKFQFILLTKYRDEYNIDPKGKKGNLGKFRKLYGKIKDSLTPDEDKELVQSLSGKMLEIYYEDIPEPGPEPDEESNQGLRHLRVSRHIETLGKAREKSKRLRKKSKRKKSKRKSKRSSKKKQTKKYKRKR